MRFEAASRSSLSALMVLLAMALAPAVQAQTTSYSGDLWSRSTLTGDWFGFRNDLADKGLLFDVNLTQVGQGVVGGGKDKGWEYGGRGNVTLQGDSQKAGLWPGGFLMVEVEGNFRDSVNGQTGALMPVDENQIFPTPPGGHVNVPAVSFMQFLSPYVGVTVGKVDTTSGDMNEFAHGKGDIQFMNLAFNFNVAPLLTVPYSTLAAGVIVLPTGDPKAATVAFNVLQSNGNSESAGFDDLSTNKLTSAGEIRVRTDFFGLTGHQLVGGTYSNRRFASLDQDLRLVIENQGIVRDKGSWSVYYNFDQFLCETEKGSGKGIGIFGRFGASDGDPNPVHYFVSAGVGGKGAIRSRPLDQFGIGFYWMDITNPQFTGPLATRSFLRDEYGFEAYYNVAITPWMHLSPDLQVIRPAQKEAVGVFPPSTIVRDDIDWVTVLGFRFRLDF